MNDLDEFRRELSRRTYGAILNDNIQTWEEISQRREYEMLRIPNFGRKSLRELKQALHSRGLDFAGDYSAPRKVIARSPDVQAGLRAAWDALHKSEEEIGRVKRRIESLMKESHNATPTQHETATLAEKRNETDD